jgi:hypothetical protein
MHARFLGVFLLIMALLSGQVAGLRHGVDHHEPDHDVPHAACQWCGAYGALDLGFAVAPPDLPAMARGNLALFIGHVSRVSCFDPLFRSRAPPRFV